MTSLPLLPFLQNGASRASLFGVSIYCLRLSLCSLFLRAAGTLVQFGVEQIYIRVFPSLLLSRHYIFALTVGFCLSSLGPQIKSSHS